LKNYQQKETKNSFSYIYSSEAEQTSFFGEWLIKLGRSIKLQAQVGIRNDVAIRKETVRAIEKTLQDFKTVTKIYARLKKSAKKDLSQNSENTVRRKDF
jgi:uncharacterized membrane protein